VFVQYLINVANKNNTQGLYYMLRVCAYWKELPQQASTNHEQLPICRLLNAITLSRSCSYACRHSKASPQETVK